jgi:hypothetical protein
MAYKTFGRLAGKTLAESALGETSDPNSTHKYDPANPGSKFAAYGEDGLSLVLNRALGAMSANTDYLYSLLGSPSFRTDILTPVRAGATNYGFTALTGLTIGTLQADLGVGASRPVQWMYLGLHQDQIGKYLKLYRRKATNNANGDISESGEHNDVEPTDAKLNSNGATASFFPAQTYPGSEEHSLVSAVPPIARIITDLPPYNQAVQSVSITKWDTDGVYITAYSSDELYLRPGCFIEVYNETSPTSNNGLWRIEEIRRADKTDPDGDKLILSRGGLHRIAVDDPTPFNAGEKVSWQSIPNDGIASALNAREHFAYIAYIADQDLYLTTLPAGEDFKVQGANIAYKSDSNAANYHGFKSAGSIGLIDRESGADQNWSLKVGTLIYNVSGAGNTDVIDAIGAGYPVRFDLTSATGNFYGCSPMGWALNPSLVFAADTVMGGDYYADCFTLTTVREQLSGAGATAARGLKESPFSELGMSRNEIHALRSYLKYMKVGNNHLTLSDNSLNGPMAASRQVLGEQLWKITVVPQGHATPVATNVSPGDTLTISMPAAGTIVSRDTTAVVVEVDANESLILKEVTYIGWSDQEDFTFSAPLVDGGVGVGSSFTAAGDLFWLDTIDIYPYLKDEAATPYYPGFGLNAAYNSMYSAIDKERGSARGKYIQLLVNNPVTLLHPTIGLANWYETFSIKADDINIEMINLKDRAGNYRARIRSFTETAPDPNPKYPAAGYGSTYPLQFYDTNTAADIDFSGPATNQSTLPTGTYSVLGAINKNVSWVSGDTNPWSTDIISGGACSYAGLDVSTAAASYTKQGQSYTEAIQTNWVTLADPSTNYITYNVSTNTYAAEATIDPSDDDKVYLHKYVVAGGIVTVDVDLRMHIQRVDQRVDLYVGSFHTPFDSYTDQVGHFDTLSGAIAAIDVMNNDSAGSYNRAWRIKVIGNVLESSTALPIAIPTDGLIIEGAPHSDHRLVWGIDNADYQGALFDMNGKSGLVWRDLHIHHDDSAATPQAVISRVVWDEATVGAVGGWLFQNVTITAAIASTLHSFLYVSGSTSATNIRVEDCNWSGASEFGIHISEPSRVWITQTELVGTETQAGVGGAVAGIYLYSAAGTEGVWVTDCEVNTFQSVGIWCGRIDKPIIRGNVIHTIDVADTTNTDVTVEAAYGIYLDLNCDKGVVSGNEVEFIGAFAGAPDTVAGIHADCSKTRVYGNSASLLGALATQYGIWLGANSTNCIADTNQTNNYGLTDAGAANTVGASNRDDV